MAKVETPRLVGERARISDGPDLLELYGDPAVATWLWPGRLGGPRTRDQISEIIRADADHWREHGFGPWVFRDRVTAALVARAGPGQGFVGGEAEVEILWSVTTIRQGQGLGTEIALAAVDVCLGPLGIPDIVAFTLSTNQASQRVMWKAGFLFEREIDHRGLPHVLFRRRAP